MLFRWARAWFIRCFADATYGRQRPVNRPNHVTNCNIFRIPCERVPPPLAAAALKKARVAKLHEDLLEEGFGDALVGTYGRDGKNFPAAPACDGQIDQRTERVFATLCKGHNNFDRGKQRRGGLNPIELIGIITPTDLVGNPRRHEM